MSNKVYNYSAGPATLPEQVLDICKKELLDWRGSGISVMEMNHRGENFGEILQDAKQSVKTLLNVPDTHEILFVQGGATAQFSAVPLNLIGKTGKADYIVSGNFSEIAAAEAEKYGKVSIAASTKPFNYTRVPVASDIRLSDNSSYLHYCSNNTVFGTAFSYVPEAGTLPLVCDMSSDIMSKPIDVAKYGLIYAGAQKNMAPAGVTMLILRKDILGNELNITPRQMSYKLFADSDSLLNTPPCWCIYMLGLVMHWVSDNGGVSGMAELKKERSAVIYDVLDNSKFYAPFAEKDSRSDINITFRTPSAEKDSEFVKEAASKGLICLAGHKKAGGLRASLYNAMTIQGAKVLAEFMKEFEVRNV
ncbi:MAG: 3-phosphoserine/phosphohydroxythreonine transaminase [Ruminococcaceae bacterium]|nr:3-phosphoserine/phosphohydroxythreonine transaminase [Oscillospiraceae bacterium]